MNSLDPSDNRSVSPAKALFMWGVIPLLGVTTQVFSAALYGLFVILTLLLESVVLWIVTEHKLFRYLKLLIYVVSLISTTLFVLLLLFIPITEKNLGLYPCLLVFMPLFLFKSYDSGNHNYVNVIQSTLKSSVGLGLLLVFVAFIREFFGSGLITYWSESTLSLLPQKIVLLPFLVQASGGFLVLAFLMILHRRFLTSKLFKEIFPSSSKTKKAILEENVQTNYKLERKEILNETKNDAVQVVLPTMPFGNIEKKKEIITDTIELESAIPEKNTGTETPDAIINTVVSGPAEESKKDNEEDLETVCNAVFSSPGDRKRILVLNCGDGSLVYRLAMMGLENQKTHKSMVFRVRGTDASEQLIQNALKGVYSEESFDELSLDLKKQYLLKSKEEDKKLILVGNDPRLHVEFEVSDGQQGRLFFHKTSDIIVLAKPFPDSGTLVGNPLWSLLFSNLVYRGALVIPSGVGFIPSGFKRTGPTVLRKV